MRGATRPQQVLFDRSWNRIDDSIWKYMPSDGTGVRTPLEVGKAWRFESKATHFQHGTAFSITGQSKVVGAEKTTTSAGTFDTFKVETTMRQINSNDQTKSSTVTATLWYAPSINRWVRKTHKTQIEGRLRELEHGGADRLFPKTVAPDDMEPVPLPGMQPGHPSSGDDALLPDTFPNALQ